MITPLDIEGSRDIQKLTNHRSKANKTVSDLVRIAEISPFAPQIWIQVERDFVKLSESPTRDIRILQPQEALLAARELERRRIKDVATSFGRHENDINRYRGILGAALTLELQKVGIISEIHA